MEDFAAALRAHRIGVLVDVRHFPGSRRNPQFSQDALRAALAEHGVRYEHLVDLGGFRKSTYEVHMATPEWQGAFAKVAAWAEGERVAVMCAETVPFRCHRRFIGDHAAAQGWHVTHILDAKRTMPQRKTAQMKLTKPQG